MLIQETTLIYILLFLFLGLSVVLAWYLSFNYPSYETAKHSFFYYLLICFVILIIFLSFLLYISDSIIHLDAPLSTVHIFLFSIGVLLLSSFFIPPSSNRLIDTHPIIFHLTVLFLILAFIMGVSNNYKTGKLDKL